MASTFIQYPPKDRPIFYVFFLTFGLWAIFNQISSSGVFKPFQDWREWFCALF